MQMTENEIKRNVLDAADQRAQVKICAELNDTDVETIRGILKDQGVDLRRLRGAVKKRIAETKPHTKSSVKADNAADKQQITVAQACAVLLYRVRELLKQKKAIEDELEAIEAQIGSVSDSIAEGLLVSE